MSTIGVKNSKRSEPDSIIQIIADYVLLKEITSDVAYDTARYCLMDTLGCGLLALDYPACIKMMGPIVPGATLINGARVPGTTYQLDPVMGAFNIGCMIRWLDFNDTWLAAEWGHPSDNLGGILAVADYLSRQKLTTNNVKINLTMKDVLTAMIKAYEIQGILALENSFNKVGLDHVLLVRVATTAVVSHLLGCNRSEIMNAISHAWIDGCALRTYRHAPNTGSRKSWAAGDATSRGVRLALIAKTGEMGYPSALTAKDWGFYDVLFNGSPFSLPRPFASYVMENILFKISYPAEFHAQTAVEAAILLHLKVKDRLDEIKTIIVETQLASLTIIDKVGTLDNPADRDHCLQYMIAIPLIFGQLTADDYEDKRAQDPRIDLLRSKMKIIENKQYTEDYYAHDKRSIGNSIQIIFNDGTQLEKVAIHYPVGHRKRRDEGIPILMDKFERHLRHKFTEDRVIQIATLCQDHKQLEQTAVCEFMDLFTSSFKNA